MMRTFLLLSLMMLRGLCHAGGPTPAGPVKWTFTSGITDGRVHVDLIATCEEGWHIYALALPRDDGPLPTLIRTTSAGTFKPAPVEEPAAEEVDDPNFGMRVRYHSGTFTFRIPIERLTNEAFAVAGEVEFMACNDRTCLPPQVVAFSVPIPASPTAR